MQDVERHARMSDREHNPQFRRPWGYHPQAQPQPAPARAPTAAEPAVLTLARERDEWLRRRAARASRKGAAL